MFRRAGSPPILLIGDLTYSADLPFDNQLPALGDKAELLESFAKVQAMKAHTPDLVVASHDTTAAAKLESAQLTVPAIF